MRPDQIAIARHIKNSDTQFCIRSKNEFLKGAISIMLLPNKIIFRKETLDSTGRLRMFSHTGSGNYRAGVTGCLKTGYFDIDKEESNEDQIVVYINQ